MSVIYTINRSKWVCGRGREDKFGHSLLLNIKGRQCIVGLLCSAHGVPNEILFGFDCPLWIPERHGDLLPAWVLEKIGGRTYKTMLTQRAMEINDSNALTLRERERELRKLFSAHGIRLIFTGRLLP